MWFSNNLEGVQCQSTVTHRQRWKIWRTYPTSWCTVSMWVRLSPAIFYRIKRSEYRNTNNIMRKRSNKYKCIYSSGICIVFSLLEPPFPIWTDDLACAPLLMLFIWLYLNLSCSGVFSYWGWAVVTLLSASSPSPSIAWCSLLWSGGFPGEHPTLSSQPDPVSPLWTENHTQDHKLC